ncbi:MAG: hypothetical protein IPG02_16265 [Ignavibacteria bacterium]|nr:hypothetical protein [Ignavibacteria bacterium]
MFLRNSIARTAKISANEFNLVYTEISDNLVARSWNERLNYVSETSNGLQRKELMLVILGSVIAAIIAKLPEIISVDPEFFTRNIGFIVFLYLQPTLPRRTI